MFYSLDYTTCNKCKHVIVRTFLFWGLQVYGDEFNTFSAVSELYGYVVKYHEAVSTSRTLITFSIKIQINTGGYK